MNGRPTHDLVVLVPGTPASWTTSNGQSNVSSFFTADLVSDDPRAGEVPVEREIINEIDRAEDVSSASDDSVVGDQSSWSAENDDRALVRRIKRESVGNPGLCCEQFGRSYVCCVNDCVTSDE